MEFDGICGNPPFDNDDDSNYTNLWSDIYKKRFKLLANDGVMAFITPTTWATPKDENRNSQTSEIQQIIGNHATFINMNECSRHFSEGSSFSYTICYKELRPKDQNVEIQTEDGIFETDQLSSMINTLPVKLDKMTIDILSRMLSKPVFKKEKGMSLKGKMIHEKDVTPANKKLYPYRVQYSDGTIKWSDTEHKVQYHKKVLFPNQTSRNYPIYDPGISSPPNRGAVYLVNSDDEGNNFVNYVKLELIQFCISMQRYHHGVLNTNVISNIPEVDLTRSWNNEELYRHFNISEEEEEHIKRILFL